MKIEAIGTAMALEQKRGLERALYEYL